jgi:twinkle protein
MLALRLVQGASKLQLSVAHAEWLEARRKIPCELAAEMGVVSKGEKLAFEYRQKGVPSFIKIRKEVKDGKPDYWIDPKGSALCMWNEDCLSERSDAPLIITEGEIDALSFLAAGATLVVSVPNRSPFDKPGEGDIRPAQDRAFSYLWDGAELKAGLQRFRKIILATDADHKGRILRDELAIRLGRTRCGFVDYPRGCKDANEVLVLHGSAALQDMIAGAKPIVPDRLVLFSEIPSRADAKRYSSGWADFDRHFMVAPPQLIVITGVPNAGKSQWALAMVANLARLHGLKGAILQFEDDPERNRRDLLRYAKTWSGKDQRNGVHEAPGVWVDRMFKTISPNEELNEERDFDLAWLDASIEEAATRHGCGWVLIDPWNEIEHLWGKQETEAAYLNRALKHLKRLGRRFQIAIIIVAHPSREGSRETIKDVNLYCINGGAAWNNKADLGVIIAVAAPDDVTKPERLIKVCKSRNFVRMGQPGMVCMRFDPAHVTFSVCSTPTPDNKD